MIGSLLMACLAFSAERTPVRWELEVDGVKRTAVVYEGQPGGPIVLGFHGHGGTGRITAASWGFHELLIEATFIYPDGLPTAVPIFDPEGTKPGWQLRVGQNDDRDLKLVRALRARVGASRPTVIAGHSNGAFFTLMLWSQPDADYRGAIEIAGAGAVAVNDRIALLAIAGKEDTLIPYRSQQTFIDRMKRTLGTGEGVTTSFLTKYTARNGVPFWTYIHDGGHSVPSAAEPVMAEFAKMAFAR